MPDKEKIDKFLTEYFGECWHEWEEKELKFSQVCYKCRLPVGILKTELINNDFFTPDGFFKLIELMKEKGNLLDVFLDHYVIRERMFIVSRVRKLLNPDTFAPAVAEFLGYKEGE